MPCMGGSIMIVCSLVHELLFATPDLTVFSPTPSNQRRRTTCQADTGAYMPCIQMRLRERAFTDPPLQDLAQREHVAFSGERESSRTYPTSDKQLRAQIGDVRWYHAVQRSCVGHDAGTKKSLLAGQRHVLVIDSCPMAGSGNCRKVVGLTTSLITDLIGVCLLFAMNEM
jgi:hypothetical protein